jgi:hypothetical protein
MPDSSDERRPLFCCIPFTGWRNVGDVIAPFEPPRRPMLSLRDGLCDCVLNRETPYSGDAPLAPTVNDPRLR